MSQKCTVIFRIHFSIYCVTTIAMLSILYISECSTEENYDEDVEEAGGVAQVGDIQLPPGIPQANVSAGYITAREEAR